MKKYKILRIISLAAAILLSHIMCAVVAYQYCALQWGGQYAGYSFPPSAAFLNVIPYGPGIALCLLLSFLFYKKE